MKLHDILNNEFLLATSIEILSEKDVTLIVGNVIEDYRRLWLSTDQTSRWGVLLIRKNRICEQGQRYGLSAAKTKIK